MKDAHSFRAYSATRRKRTGRANRAAMGPPPVRNEPSYKGRNRRLENNLVTNNKMKTNPKQSQLQSCWAAQCWFTHFGVLAFRVSAFSHVPHADTKQKTVLAKRTHLTALIHKPKQECLFYSSLASFPFRFRRFDISTFWRFGSFCRHSTTDIRPSTMDIHDHRSSSRSESGTR